MYVLVNLQLLIPCPPTHTLLPTVRRSWGHTKQHIYGCLGFIYQHIVPAVRVLDLTAIRDHFHPGCTSYISFLYKRHTEGDYMAKVCYTIIRVLCYLEATAQPPYDAAAKALHARQLATINTLKYQVNKITYTVPFDAERLKEQGLWKDGSELIALVEKTKHKAIAAMKVSSRRRRAVGAAASAAMWWSAMPSSLASQPLQWCCCAEAKTIFVFPCSPAGPACQDWQQQGHRCGQRQAAALPRAGLLRNSPHPRGIHQCGRAVVQGHHAGILLRPRHSPQAQLAGQPHPPRPPVGALRGCAMQAARLQRQPPRAGC